MRLITVLLVVYVYNAAHDTFEQLPAMPVHLPSQIRNAKNALQLIEEGEKLVFLDHAMAPPPPLPNLLSIAWHKT